MKSLVLAFAAMALVPANSALAADTPAPSAPSRLNLDTPIDTIASDPAGRKVLDTDLPGVVSHPQYEMFKGMSLHQLAGYSDKLTPELLAKVQTDLAAVK